MAFNGEPVDLQWQSPGKGRFRLMATGKPPKEPAGEFAKEARREVG
jgi:hypothetical protein